MATWFLNKLDSLTCLVVATVMTTCQSSEQESDRRTITANYLAHPSQMLMKVWINHLLKNPPTVNNSLSLHLPGSSHLAK
jgi:hypothetical protein